jgi:hypothetical protein
MLAQKVTVVATASKMENVGSQFLSLQQVPEFKHFPSMTAQTC